MLFEKSERVASAVFQFVFRVAELVKSFDLHRDYPAAYRLVDLVYRWHLAAVYTILIPMTRRQDAADTNRYATKSSPFRGRKSMALG